MRALALVASLVSIASLTACADAGPTESYVTLVPLGDEQADGVTETRVRADGATVWLQPALRPIETPVEGDAGGATRWQFVLSGRFSRNLASVISFVPDDVFGAATAVSARKFQVAFDAGHELSTLTYGLPTLLAFSTGTSTTWTARLTWATSLTGFSGSGGIWIERALPGVFVVDHVVYRMRFAVPPGATEVTAEIGGVEVPVLAEGDDEYRVDLGYDQLVVAAGAAGAGAGGIVISAERADGVVISKKARAQIAVARVDTTLGDPYEVWPPASCNDEVKACVLGETACATTDTEVCGSAWEVTRCFAAPEISSCRSIPRPTSP